VKRPSWILERALTQPLAPAVVRAGLGPGESHIARRPALGLGADFELSAEGAIGSGVWLGDRPAHFSGFGQPMADGSDAA